MKKRVTCRVCGEDVERVAAALYKKLVDKQAKKFYCLSCLAEYLDTTVEELREKADEFKNQGCTLFG